MPKQLLIYENAKPITVADHQDVSIKTVDDYRFAADLNSVPLVAAEFSAAANDCAIVFTGTQSAVFPAVMLGLESDRNVFVDDKGRWLGKYIPAFLRRYPFVFAQTQEGSSFTLCIDEAYGGLNKAGQGERLFDADGERTQFLGNILGFAAQYQAQFERTRVFCNRLVELDLLEAASANFTSDDGTARRLTGFFTINREKLRAISETAMVEMFKTDELELCFVHLQSLNNVDDLAVKYGLAEMPEEKSLLQ